MYFHHIKYLLVVISCCLCGVLSDNSTEDAVSSGLRMMLRTYHTCEQTQDTLACLKMRALKFADRVLKSEQLPITDGMVLVKTSQDEVGRGLDENLEEVDEEGMSQDPRTRHDKLDDLLLDRVSRFLKTHSLQLNMPRFLADSRQIQGDDLVNQGRYDKMKKYGGMMMMGAMMKAGMMMLGMGGVSMLAGKALIVAKIALVLAVVLGLGKLLGGGGGGGKTTYEVIKTPHVSHAHTHSSSHEYGGGSDGGSGETTGTTESGGGGGHYARSLGDFHSHLLAYNGQIPTNAEHALIPDSMAQS